MEAVELSTKTITSILTDHNMKWKKQPGSSTIEVLDVWTQNGTTFESWMLCPTNSQALYQWLGY